MLIESVDGVEQTVNAARQISLSTKQQQIASSHVVLALKDIDQGVRFATGSTDANASNRSITSWKKETQCNYRIFKCISLPCPIYESFFDLYP